MDRALRPVTPLVGIFTGGASRRMGGRPKGLLPARNGRETLAARLKRLCAEALGAPHVVLVGKAAAYSGLGLESIADDPPGVGPIGGLRALLRAAEQHGAPFAIALSCDLPDVTSELIHRLATDSPARAAMAAKVGDIWQPLFARYAAPAVLDAIEASLAARSHALQSVLARLGPELGALPLEPGDAQLLGDWDEPADLDRPRQVKASE